MDFGGIVVDKKEAEQLILKKYPDHKIMNFIETNNYFVAHIVVNTPIKKGGAVMRGCDDGLKAVEKKTGTIITYNPMLDD